MRTATTLLAAAVTAALTITPAAASAASRPATHRIEWRHSGLCLTADGATAGSLVIVTRCGAKRDAWKRDGRRLRLGGTRLVLGIGPDGLTDLAHVHGRRTAWRWLPARRALENIRQSRRSGQLIVLAWRPGTPAGRRAWLDVRWPAIRWQERWRLPRA